MTNNKEMPDEIYAKRYGQSSGGTYWSKPRKGETGTKYIRASSPIVGGDVKEAFDSMPEIEWNEDHQECDVVIDDVVLWYLRHADIIRRALTATALDAGKVPEIEGLAEAIEEMDEFEWDAIGVLKNIILIHNKSCTCNASCCDFCIAHNVYNDANKCWPTVMKAARAYLTLTASPATSPDDGVKHD